MTASRARPPEQSPARVLYDAAWHVIRARLGEGLLVAGICGAQGSGKTTLARALAMRAESEGIATAALSLDDLYLSRAEREGLGRDVHPLLRTRGVPGTHDVALGLAMISALEEGDAARLPRFDKGRDDRAPESDWPFAPAHCRLLILEGWCLGAVPQDEASLAEPVNALERDEDPNAVWRSYANRALQAEYGELFARLDLLVLLAAPGFEVVRDWRIEQELALRAAGAPAAMDDAAITRFIQHYERLTRHILDEMPARADLVAWLNRDRTVRRIVTRP
ncbi:MAG: kinase [Novosphingobium sp.]